jgi:Na+-translocating ferredoxin:NAD+ oxidoreductase RnfC subunit
MNLPVILIKEAIDKQNWERAKSLGLEYCDACGHCSYVCPARIDLKTAIVAAKEKMQAMRANA